MLSSCFFPIVFGLGLFLVFFFLEKKSGHVRVGAVCVCVCVCVCLRACVRACVGAVANLIGTIRLVRIFSFSLLFFIFLILSFLP